MSKIVGSKLKYPVAACIISLFLLAAYSNSFKSEFHFDDYHQFLQNPSVRSLGSIPRFFISADLCSVDQSLKGYRPLTFTSFAVNYAASGYNVVGYHILSFIIHLACSFVVFLIVLALLGGAGKKGVYFTALLVSLAFALHPIQTNAVTYVSGRAAILASLFFLLASYAFIRFRSGGGFLPAIASPIFFLMALLSKEMAVSFIGLILVYDLLFTLPKSKSLKKSLKDALYYIPFAGMLAAFLMVRKIVQGYCTVSEQDHGVREYLVSEAKVLLMYLRLLVLPFNQNVDYDLPVSYSFDVRLAVSVVLVCLAAYLLFRLRKSHPALSFFGAWFFITLMPESSFIPIRDLAVEYRLYLPSAGFIAFAIVGAGILMENKAARKAAAAALIILLAILTFNRNKIWSTEYSLWRDVVKKSDYSARAHANYGASLVYRGQYYEAMEELYRSLAINPFYTQSYYVYSNLGTCYYKLGMLPEAVEQFDIATKVNPGFSEGYGNMGAALYELGRYGEAIDVLVKCLIINPEYFDGRVKLAQSYFMTGRKAEGLRELDKAFRQRGGGFDLRYLMAALYFQNGVKDKAVESAEALFNYAVNDTQRRSAAELLAKMQGK